LVVERRHLLMAGLLGASLAPSVARADCNTPASYQVTVDASTVTVCPRSTSRNCGSSIDLLRQNTADGTVVIVGATCSQNCYVDTCVPPGTYRYGWATAYDCSEAGCGDPSLFEEATVTADLSSSCSPAANTTPTTTEPPWGAGASPAQFIMCDNGCGCATESSDRRRVRFLDGFAVVVGLSLIVWRRRQHVRAARRSS
jgi:MYXO-CTERM domain-containing protein